MGAASDGIQPGSYFLTARKGSDIPPPHCSQVNPVVITVVFIVPGILSNIYQHPGKPFRSAIVPGAYDTPSLVHASLSPRDSKQFSS